MQRTSDVLEFSDADLAEQALAMDIDTVVAPDAEPFVAVRNDVTAQPLPSWYMPAPAPSRARVRGWRRVAVLGVIAAFLLIDAYGLCNTYGDIANHGSPRSDQTVSR